MVTIFEFPPIKVIMSEIGIITNSYYKNIIINFTQRCKISSISFTA